MSEENKVVGIPQDIKQKIEAKASWELNENTFITGAEFGYSLAQQEIERLEKSEAGWKAAFEILEYLIKKKAESQEEFRRFCNTLTKEIQNNL